MARRVVVLLTLLAFGPFASPANADRATRPDLVVASFSGPLAVTAGGKPILSDKTSNKGGPARASSTRFFLSRDRKRGKDIRVGARKVGPLKAKRSSKGSARVAIPDKVKPGRYYVLACADGAGKVAETNERNNCRASEKPTQVIAAFKPQPLNVNVVPETARAATKEITTAGGTLLASGADGTEFALVVPKDALASAELITITPLSTIEGLPFQAGLSGGLLLEPRGLSFNRPVTARILPAKPVPPNQEATFSFAGDGKDFHLYPVSHKDGSVDFELTHFSGVGLAPASAPEFNRQGNRVPTTREAWTRQQLQELTRELYEAAQAGDDPDPSVVRKAGEAAELALFVWGNEGVLPLATAAATDASLFARAADEYFAWERTQQLLGTRARRAEALDALIVAQLKLAFENAVNESYLACLEGDFTQPARLMGFAWKAEVDASFGGDVGDVGKMLSNCARFELDYDLEWTADSQFQGEEGHVRVHKMLLTGSATGRVTGQKDLEWVSVRQYHKSSGACYFTVVGGPEQPFEVTGFEFDLNRFPARYLIMNVDPGSSLEHVTHTCPDEGGGGSSHTYREGVYNRAWMNVHFKLPFEVIGANLAISRWDSFGGTPYASTTITGSRTDAIGTTYEGISTWVLRHVPLRSN